MTGEIYEISRVGIGQYNNCMAQSRISLIHFWGLIPGHYSSRVERSIASERLGVYSGFDLVGDLFGLFLGFVFSDTLLDED